MQDSLDTTVSQSFYGLGRSTVPTRTMERECSAGIYSVFNGFTVPHIVYDKRQTECLLCDYALWILAIVQWVNVALMIVSAI